jgi:hypothetical protein
MYDRRSTSLFQSSLFILLTIHPQDPAMRHFTVVVASQRVLSVYADSDGSRWIAHRALPKKLPVTFAN